MKNSPANSLTLGLVAALLAGAGICVAVRHSLDQRQAAALAAVSSSGSGQGNSHAGGTRETAAATAAPPSRIGDREAFRKRLRSLVTSGDPIMRSQKLLELIDGLSPADFPVFFEEMKKICAYDDPALLLAFSAWVEADPAGAMRKQSRGGVLNLKAMGADEAGLKIWAERDPVGALTWLTENDGYASQLSIVLENFASDDPAAALAWAKSHDAAPGKDEPAHGRVAAVLKAMLPGRMEEALREIAQLPDDMRESVVSAVSAKAGGMTPGQRLQWLESMPTEDLKNAAVAGMVSSMAGWSLEDRLALLKEHPGALEKPGGARIYNEWVMTDQDAAEESLGKLPEGPLQNAAVVSTLNGLGSLENTAKAVELMDRYPEAITDEALENWVFCTTFNGRNCELALAQLQRFGSSNMREFSYGSILEKWFSSDREAARAWLDSHEDVPASIRERYGYR